MDRTKGEGREVGNLVTSVKKRLREDKPSAFRLSILFYHIAGSKLQ